MLHVRLRTAVPRSWLTLCIVAVGCQGQPAPAAQSGGSSGAQAVGGEAGASGGRAGADSIAGAGANAAGGASGVTGGVGTAAAGRGAGSSGAAGASAGSAGQGGVAAVGGGAGDAGNGTIAGAGGVAGHSGTGGDAGHAGTGGASGGGGGASTMVAVQAIFDAHCTNCHDATNTHVPGFAALPLTADRAHAALVSQPATETCGGTLVVPGNSANSYLVHKLTDNPPCDGSHMPRPFEVGPMLSLSADELSTVRAWIDSGARP